MDYLLIKPNYYFTLLKDLVRFIKRPTLKEATGKSTPFKIYDTIGLYLVKFVLLIPVVLFFALVYDPENVQHSRMSERFGPWSLLLVGGFILPFIEEVAFRLSLRFKPIYLALSLSVISYYILTKLVYGTNISLVDESFLPRVGAAVGVGLLLYPFFTVKSIRTRLAAFWARYFAIIYYSTCLLFAWIHITKYELNLTNVLLLPILTLPQLLSALIYGYIRISFGFQYPLFFHMGTNVVAIGLSFLPFSDLLIY